MNHQHEDNICTMTTIVTIDMVAVVVMVMVMAMAVSVEPGLMTSTTTFSALKISFWVRCRPLQVTTLRKQNQGAPLYHSPRHLGHSCRDHQTHYNDGGVGGSSGSGGGCGWW